MKKFKLGTNVGIKNGDALRTGLYFNFVNNIEVNISNSFYNNITEKTWENLIESVCANISNWNNKNNIILPITQQNILQYIKQQLI